MRLIDRIQKTLLASYANMFVHCFACSEVVQCLGGHKAENLLPAYSSLWRGTAIQILERKECIEGSLSNLQGIR